MNADGVSKGRRLRLAVLSLAVLAPSGLAGLVVAENAPGTCFAAANCPSEAKPTCSPEDSGCNGGASCSFNTPEERTLCLGRASETSTQLPPEEWTPGVTGLLVRDVGLPDTTVPLSHDGDGRGYATWSKTYLQYSCSFIISDRSRACFTGQGQRIRTDGHFFEWCAQPKGQPCQGTTEPTSGTKDMWPNANFNGWVLWCVSVSDGVLMNTCMATWTDVTWIAVNDAKDWAKGWARGGTQGWTS